VRHYPHFWISTRGLGPSGTSTRLRHKLPGTHYENVDLLLHNLECLLDTLDKATRDTPTANNVAHLGAFLCEEVERRLEVFSQAVPEEKPTPARGRVAQGARKKGKASGTNGTHATV